MRVASVAEDEPGARAADADFLEVITAVAVVVADDGVAVLLVSGFDPDGAWTEVLPERIVAVKRSTSSW